MGIATVKAEVVELTKTKKDWETCAYGHGLHHCSWTQRLLHGPHHLKHDCSLSRGCSDRCLSCCCLRAVDFVDAIEGRSGCLSIDKIICGIQIAQQLRGDDMDAVMDGRNTRILTNRMVDPTSLEARLSFAWNRIRYTYTSLSSAGVTLPADVVVK
eukprot:scaffold4855_cov195-Amphora_coffeaeformis.AAC.9